MSVYTAKGALRSVKNYAKGYTDVQAKVREATSNDPWGPSGTLMNEIAQATYNQHDFMEIMEMVDKRLNDKGKNWRHVFKALTLLDYCLHMGSDNVVVYVKENQYIVKTLKEFQHVDETGKDVGANVRQKAKDITNLLSDDARLKEERRQRSAMQSRLASSSTRGFDESILWEGGVPPNREVGHDDDRELQRAIEESKRSARDDEMKRHNPDTDLERALEESKREAREKEKLKQERERQQNDADLLGGLDTAPSTFNPFPAQQDFLNPFPQQQLQYDFFGNSSPNAQYQQAQLTGFSNPYQQQLLIQQQALVEEQQRQQQQQQQQLLLQQQAEEQQRQQQQQLLLQQQALAEEQQRQLLQQQQALAEEQQRQLLQQEAARQEAARQEAARQEAARQEAARQEAARQAALLQQQQAQQQQLLIVQQQAQQQLAHHQALLLQQQQQQATQQFLAAQQLQPAHTGTNPFGQFGQQAQSQFSPSLSFASQQGLSPSFASQGSSQQSQSLSTSSSFPNTAKRPADERHADLVAALSKGDGMDTFGNTGNLRIPVGSGFSNTLASEFAKPASPNNASAPNPFYGGQTSSATGDLLGLGSSSSGFGSSQSSFNRAPSPTGSAASFNTSTTSTFGTSGSLLDIDSSSLGGGSFGQQQSRNPFQSTSPAGQWNTPARTGNQQSLNDLLVQQQRQQQLGGGFAQPQQPQFTGNFGASQFGGQQNGFGF